MSSSPRGMNRRALMMLSLLGATAPAALAACSGSSSGSGSSTSGSGGYGDISVQLSWIKNIEFSGEYFAITEGHFTDAGFGTVDLIAGGSAGTSAESAVVSGKAFVGLSSPTVTAPAINEGATLKIVGATYQQNPFCILSIETNPIATPQDMVGKKIGVQSGTNEVIFNALLKANGIDASSLTTVPVQYDPTVLITGEVDGFVAYITNEPILIESKGHTPTTFLMADNGLPLVAETFTVTQDAIDNEREKVKAYLKAEILGWKAAVADPAGSAKLAVENFGKDQGLDLEEQTAEAEAQAKLVANDDTAKNGLFTMTDELIAQNIEALAAAGTTITAEQLFDLSLLEEVYAENPDLKA